ncbi:MAG: NAD(P)-dependent oxidoreductase [Deltaproteobacteria bacterium]|nr:MAG: NAD(P)-dependent oxidoreductase [Deltaproteobacteria bacterium]
MSLPKLLVTGSRGRIGSVLMQGLADSFELYGVDLLAGTGRRAFSADLADCEQIREVMRQIAPLPYIVHLAGDPRVHADWNSVLKNNIVATRNLYEAAKEQEVKRVVFASSNHVTGAYEGIPPRLHEVANPEPITVNDPVRPDSDYGTSKIFGEAIARQYNELHGMASVCLRIGSVLADDKPTRSARVRRTWLSHRDLIQLFMKSILSDVTFGIYYGVSDNRSCFWDISNARKELGYQPQDDASLY